MSSQPLHNEENEQDDLDNQGHVVDDTEGDHPHRVRRRVKIRKKVRIRKKSDPKKKLKKIGERVFWIALVIGFVAALVIFVLESDIKDPKQKKLQQKQLPSGKTY
ncbi:MAG: hypothetical protein ACO3O0_06650 [Bacteroidia bacterium]|jgi:hypothetical protein